LLWALGDPGRLGSKARLAIESPASVVYASAVSAWEIAIKQSLSKLELPGLAEAWLLPAVEQMGFGMIC
jgi:PIN domain nuclease of toxin-antitoxin system